MGRRYLLVCPKCKSRAIGRIGQNQYYCWDCSIEFVPVRDGFRMYRLEEDGTVLLDSLDGTAQSLSMSTIPGEAAVPPPQEEDPV